MLRIIRINRPSKDAVGLELCHALVTNLNIGYEKKIHKKRCLSTSSQIRLPLEASDRNVFTTNCKTALLRHGKSCVFDQRRHFSLRSTIESFAATQSGIFKAISESTPVEYCQKYLLYMHDVTGLPWWASIILSTIIVRTVVTLPFAVYQQMIVARIENLKSELPEIAEELRKETSLAVKMYNWDERYAKATFNRSMKKQWDELIIRDNCHPLKTTVLLWVQVPLWVSMSVSIRNLVYMLPVKDLNAQLTFTELAVGGFSFIPNLTLPDASWIFPVTLGIINLAIIEIQVLSKDPSMKSTKVQKFLTNVFRGISIFMVPIAASVPSCLVLYWTTSSAYGLVQNLVLMSPKVKRLLKIPHTIIEPKEPYKKLVDNLKVRFKVAN